MESPCPARRHSRRHLGHCRFLYCDPERAEMIVSLVSSALGMLGGLLPDVFREVRESREHARELERMDRQAELQAKLLAARSEARLAEIEGNSFAEEMRAFRAQMKSIYDT